jgi:hypothetical protein
VSNEFENYAEIAKEMFDYVAVCRQKHGLEQIFTVPFETEEQLADFLMRNHGNCGKIGFYAKGFSEGEYFAENT